MSFEDRLKDFAADLGSKIDKSIKELLYGYYPDLTEKEFAICEMIASAVWEHGLYFYGAVVGTTAREYKELFHNTDEVETVIKQLIEKGIVRDQITFIRFGIKCKSNNCERSLLCPVRLLNLKDEIEGEAFMIYSSHFGSSTTEYFGPVKPEISEGVELDFNIQMGKKEYLPSQPSIAYLKLTNNGSKPVSLIDRLDPEYSVVKFYIKSGDEEFRFFPYTHIDFLAEERKLNPSESIYGHAKIFYGAKGYSFPKVGTYKVRATYEGLFGGLGKQIDSNIIDVKVRPPRNKEEEEQVKLIKGDQQALFFLVSGEDDLTEGIDKLTNLAIQYPDSELGSYANAVLGLHWSREFKDLKNNKIRKPDNEKALSFLETASRNTTGYWADAAFMNLADSYKRAGEKTSTRDVLNKYITKFEKDTKNANGIMMARKILDEEL
jgi:hypothetical protein